LRRIRRTREEVKEGRKEKKNEEWEESKERRTWRSKNNMKRAEELNVFLFFFNKKFIPRFNLRP
jgi:hypothetical protein